MYTQNETVHTSINIQVPLSEGELLEAKIRRAMANNEPLESDVKPIYAAREQGIIQGTDIREDKWETAAKKGAKITEMKIEKRKQYHERKSESETKEPEQKQVNSASDNTTQS